VRSLLVPALTSLFGEFAWWPGRRVRRAAEDDLIERVAARAGVGTTQADTAMRAALVTLAERITRRETRTLTARLPREMAGQIRRAARSPERFGADEFVRRMSEREGVPPGEARRHARAVLTTLEEQSADRLAYVRAQLSDDYGAFFADAARAPRAETPPLERDEPGGRGEPGGRDAPTPREEPPERDAAPRVRRAEAAGPAATDRSARRD
jgi:uncharacterized protein (DUF2267 family)